MLQLLLPVLFPSWRFFLEVGPSPRLEYRLACDENWRSATHRPARLGLRETLKRLIWNPDWNESLYLLSFAERLVDDPAAQNAHLLARRIAARVPEQEGSLQFRVTFATGSGQAELGYQSVPASLSDLRE